MEQLSQLYDQPIKKNNLIDRKLFIDAAFTLVTAPQGVGSTTLLFSALSRLKNATYLYLDLDDSRIDKVLLDQHLNAFCTQHKIQTLAIDGYDGSIQLPNVPNIYLSSSNIHYIEGFKSIQLLPLDFEEFLALDPRYDNLDTALSHFLQIGGFPQMIQINATNRARHLQSLLRLYLNDLELDILTYVSKQLAHKLSVFQVYERLKNNRKLSKDHFYKVFYSLIERRWLLWLAKYDKPKATKKLYLIDFAIKNALTFSKNFSKLFESLVFLELIKAGKELYYDDAIDFYIPSHDRVVITIPFATEKNLFALMEKIEGYVIEHGVTKVEVVTMNHEAKLDHPFVEVEMMPFTRWALIES